jgi:hypothetical protein
MEDDTYLSTWHLDTRRTFDLGVGTCTFGGICEAAKKPCHRGTRCHLTSSDTRTEGGAQCTAVQYVHGERVSQCNI